MSRMLGDGCSEDADGQREGIDSDVCEPLVYGWKVEVSAFPLFSDSFFETGSYDVTSV